MVIWNIENKKHFSRDDLENLEIILMEREDPTGDYPNDEIELFDCDEKETLYTIDYEVKDNVITVRELKCVKDYRKFTEASIENKIDLLIESIQQDTDQLSNYPFNYLITKYSNIHQDLMKKYDHINFMYMNNFIDIVTFNKVVDSIFDEIDKIKDLIKYKASER